MQQVFIIHKAHIILLNYFISSCHLISSVLCTQITFLFTWNVGYRVTCYFESFWISFHVWCWGYHDYILALIHISALQFSTMDLSLILICFWLWDWQQLFGINLPSCLFSLLTTTKDLRKKMALLFWELGNIQDSVGVQTYFANRSQSIFH